AIELRHEYGCLHCLRRSESFCKLRATVERVTAFAGLVLLEPLVDEHAFAAGERLDSGTLCGNAEPAAALLGCADSQVGDGVHVGSCDPGRHSGACLEWLSMPSTVVEPDTDTVWNHSS